MAYYTIEDDNFLKENYLKLPAKRMSKLLGRSESFTIDRRYNDVGYHIDNIQVMTRVDNIKKYFSYDYRNKVAIVTTDRTVYEDGPF